MPVRLSVQIAEIGPVQTELRLETPDVLQANLHQSVGFRSVRVKDLNRYLGAERRSVPAHGNARACKAIAAEKRRAGRGRSDRDHAPAREICV